MMAFRRALALVSVLFAVFVNLVTVAPTDNHKPTQWEGGTSVSGARGSKRMYPHISNQDWKSADRDQAVILTEQERWELRAEGYPIPQRFPLTKDEERNLRKVRRKIKNRFFAQESRRRKKEYTEDLETKVHLMELRMAELERDNRLLREQLVGAESSPADVDAAENSPNLPATPIFESISSDESE